MDDFMVWIWVFLIMFGFMLLVIIEGVEYVDGVLGDIGGIFIDGV